MSVVVLIAEVGEASVQLDTAAEHAVQALAPSTRRLQEFAQPVQPLPQLVQGVEDALVAADLQPATPSRRRAEKQPQITRRLCECIRLLGYLRHVTGLPVIFGLRIPRQLQELAPAYREAEKVAGHPRQLVRLVHDEYVRSGQQFPESLVLQRQIGTQEVVIYDQDVSLLGLAPGLCKMTVAVNRAFLAQAIVHRGGHQGPDRGVFRHFGQFGPIAAGGAAGPAAYPLQ